MFRRIFLKGLAATLLGIAIVVPVLGTRDRYIPTQPSKTWKSQVLPPTGPLTEKMLQEHMDRVWLLSQNKYG